MWPLHSHTRLILMQLHMEDPDEETGDIPTLLVTLDEELNEEDTDLAELSTEDSTITVRERPHHLTERIQRQSAPDGLDPDTYVWLEWDEFKDSEPTFPRYHSIDSEEGCGKEEVAPCALTTEQRASGPWFLAEPCSYCFGEATITRVEGLDSGKEVVNDER